jgi:anti-sigma factor RsiW
MAAAILVAAILAGGLAVIPFDGRGGDGSVREVASAHRQSQATGQWTDVASANPSDVVRWVSGSASGFTPPVANLRSAGFDLVGARRASVDDQPAVALVYRREHWIIDLFVVPAPAAAAEHARLNREDDLAVVDWTESGLRFFAVSDLDGDALMRFHKSVEDAIRSP